jgi:hypothetical protein
MALIDVYAIIDVAHYSLGIVRFVRYQTNPQGNIVYHGPSVDGSIRFVHEVAGQKNANSINYTRNQNIYNDVVNGTFKRDTVSGWPTNPFGPSSTIPKIISTEKFSQFDAFKVRNLTFRNMCTRTYKDVGSRSIRDGGRSEIYSKSDGVYNFYANFPSYTFLGDHVDITGYEYNTGSFLTDVSIWNVPGDGGRMIFQFNPDGRNGTRTRGFHYYDRVSRLF